MKNEEIVVEQQNWGAAQHINYRVLKLVNRLEPRIGETLTESEVREYLDLRPVKITVLPPSKDE